MNWLLTVWDKAEEFIGGALALAATCIVIYATVLRYFWHISPSWAIEVVIYLIIWSAFVLASCLIRENGHIGADFVVTRYSLTTRCRIEIGTTAFSLAFMCVVLWLGILHVYDLYDFDAQSATALRFPLWIAHGAVPFGAALMVLRLLQRLYLLVFEPTEVAVIQEEPLL